MICYADWSVDFSHLAKLFDIVVHLLVGQNRECLIVLERYILVLVKNGACHIVQVAILFHLQEKICTPRLRPIIYRCFF